MNLRQLRYFVAVAEEEHFGHAARRLHITQPPLSQQIKALEEDLGVQLLERTTRSVQLTPAGARFLERALGILREMDDAASEARRVQEGLSGHVRLSFVGSAPYALLPRLVSRLRRELPDIHLDLSSELLTAQQADALLGDRTDLAVISVSEASRVSRQLRATPIRTTRLVVAMHTGHPLAARASLRLEELVDEPFLMHPSGGRSVLHRKVRDLTAAAGFTPLVAQEVHETVTAVSLAAAGLGVAVLPDSVRSLTIAGAVYRPLDDEDAVLHTMLATRSDDRRATVERVRQTILEEVGGSGDPG